MECSQTLIEGIKTLLSPRKEIVLAYPFGSFSKGVSTPLSDIDIAVLIHGDISEEKYPYGYRSELLTYLMKGLRTNRIDLVILNDAPPFLKFQVVRNEQIIISRSEKKRKDSKGKITQRIKDGKGLRSIKQDTSL